MRGLHICVRRSGLGHGHDEQHHPCHDAADNSHKRTNLDPVAELDRMVAVLFEETRCDDVGRGSDHGDVAAIAGTEEKRPPED